MKMKRVLSGLVGGAGAGLAAGIAAGVLLSIMAIRNRQGDLTWAITLASGPLRTDRLLGGWVIQLVFGTALGVLFGLIFKALRPSLSSATPTGKPSSAAIPTSSARSSR